MCIKDQLTRVYQGPVDKCVSRIGCPLCIKDQLRPVKNSLISFLEKLIYIMSIEDKGVGRGKPHRCLFLLSREKNVSIVSRIC